METNDLLLACGNVTAFMWATFKELLGLKYLFQANVHLHYAKGLFINNA